MKKTILLLISLALIYNLYGQNSDYTRWWIYNYGDYAKTEGKNDPRVKWGEKVFERLNNAADKAAGRIPRLHIINKKGTPYALAVPDGGIIINPTAIYICYNGVDREEGDRRLSFIIGHELAHLANKDFMHREAFLVLRKYGDEKAQDELVEYFKLTEPEKAKECKKKELLADKNGAFYSAMAGYDISRLFGKKNDFFHHWAKQTGIGSIYDEDPKHPSIEKRVHFIRTQLEAVVKQTDLFRAGVLLFHMESYHDSAAAFFEFSKAYPAREVFNNIGGCYLNLALRHLYLKFNEEYYKFMFSTAIDYSTSAELLQIRGEGDYLKDKEISNYINKAEEYFKRAAARDLHDRTCRYNLTAALIIKKEYAEALSKCSDILKKNPNDVYAMNNKAIAFYYYGKEEDLETTQKAIGILKKAHKLKPGNVAVLYNLASLKQKRERRAGAKLYWEKYLKMPTIPKDNFYYYVYKKLNGTDPTKIEKAGDFPVRPGGISLGEDFSRVEKRWGKENVREYKLGSSENENNDGWFINLQLINKQGVRVLALDGMVEIIEREFSPPENTAGMLKRFGSPQRIVRHSSGNFYVYQDKGFSIKEINGKIRSAIWFEKEF